MKRLFGSKYNQDYVTSHLKKDYNILESKKMIDDELENLRMEINRDRSELGTKESLYNMIDKDVAIKKLEDKIKELDDKLRIDNLYRQITSIAVPSNSNSYVSKVPILPYSVVPIYSIDNKSEIASYIANKTMSSVPASGSSIPRYNPPSARSSPANPANPADLFGYVLFGDRRTSKGRKIKRPKKTSKGRKRSKKTYKGHKRSKKIPIGSRFGYLSVPMYTTARNTYNDCGGW